HRPVPPVKRKIRSVNVRSEGACPTSGTRLSLALRPVLRKQAHHLARLQAGFVPDVLVDKRAKPRRERESVCVRYLLCLRVKPPRQRHAERHLLGGAGGREALG